MGRSSGSVLRDLLFALGLPIWLAACGGSDSSPPAPPPPPPQSLDEQLRATLAQQGFTGTVEQKLESRLGRPLDFKRADLGRLLFFDPVSSLHNDNSCAACHSPSHGYGDTQSIAIGIQNNLIVGPDRQGPRNRRRSPLILNAGFFPRLMWNGRFFAPSGDPFDNSLGFSFPQPEGTTTFRPHDRRSRSCWSRRPSCRRRNSSKKQASRASAMASIRATSSSTTAREKPARRSMPAAFATARSARASNSA